MAVGGKGGLTEGVGIGGDFGDGGLGRTRVGNGGDQIASAVKNIVKQIEAGFWHANIVGTEAVGTEVVGVGGKEQELHGHVEQNCHECEIGHPSSTAID